jgi:hypothetical protein
MAVGFNRPDHYSSAPWLSTFAACAMWSLGGAVLSGCGPSEMGPKPTDVPTAPAHTEHGHDDHAHGDHDHGHVHGKAGPHKGTIVVVAGHQVHVELVLDQAEGKLTAYVLNDEIEKPLAIKQDKLVIGFVPKGAPAAEGAKTEELTDSEEITLTAVSPTAEGEATEFTGQSDKLKGVAKFDGLVTAVTFNGKEYKDVKFEFPEGNEHLEH